MSQNIRSIPVGTIYYQSGNGVPIHIATRGCTYVDIDTGTFYINKDGLVDWENLLDNPVDYIEFNTGNTSTHYGGQLFWDDTTNSLAYKPFTLNNDVTVNIGQENLILVFNQTGSQINNGQAVMITGATLNFPTISLAIASDGNNTLFDVDGIATHDIPNNSFGFITQFGSVNDVNLSGFSLGQKVYLSQTVAGGLTSYNNLYFTGRTTEIGHVLNNTVNGKLEVSIVNESLFSNITQLEANILNTNTSSTGLFYFSGISIQSPTTFNVGPAKGWIVDNISDPIKPTIKYVEFNGLTGQTTPYLNTNPITYILLTSGATLSLQPTPPTPKQRRQNIYLGKLGHANLTSIIQAFNEPDIEESPLSQVRDMFQPIRLINGGVYPSVNGANLNFNTSSGYLYGFGINFINDNFTPNTLTISGQSPCTFQYRTQTGGTSTNVTLIDPTNYDNGGVITTIGGGTNRSTNQRIFLTQNGTIRVQYGQTIYATLAEAIAASQTESFNTFSNFRDNAILIGILSLRHTTTNLSDTSFASFLLVSKFGETIGAAGGISTSTLQQAYNNSTSPEIITNSILDGLSIKNGTGSPDSTSNLFEGLDTAGNATSFIKADGSISGTTFITNGLTATTISATTYQNLPLDISVTGGTYSGNTITFSNNTGGTFSVTGITTGSNFTGGTVSGATNFTGGLTATTISATTYQGINRSFGVSFDGMGSVITVNSQSTLTIPYNMVIQSWVLLSDVTGSIVIDLWKDTYANYPPTSGDSITASAKPNISAGTKNQSSTLTGWNTIVNSGDIIRFNVDSCTGMTKSQLTIIGKEF